MARILKVKLPLIFLLALATALPASNAQEDFAAISGDEGVTIMDGVRPVLTFQKANRSKEGRWQRSNYVHPLYNLDGESITEDFPADHGHHRGVFWAWHQVVLGDKQIGDAWLCKDFDWEVKRAVPRKESGNAVIETSVTWSSSAHVDDKGESIPLVQERAQIKAYPKSKGYRAIDFKIQLLALVDSLKIGGSDDSKGYGGFSPRIQLKEDYVFSGSEGELEPVKNAVSAGDWVDIANDEFGFSMMSHKSNPGHPQPWILRRARSMQNAVYPGRKAVALSTEEPLVLRYRIVIHRGQLSADDLHAIYEDFLDE